MHRNFAAPYRLKRNFAISWPKFTLIFFGTVLYLQLSGILESHLPLILFSCPSHFQSGWYIARSQCSKEYFPIFCCCENHLTKACVHGFIIARPTAALLPQNFMRLPVAKLEVREERLGLLLTLTDSTYRTTKYYSTNSGRTVQLT